jgi:hypothetical protein
MLTGQHSGNRQRRHQTLHLDLSISGRSVRRGPSPTKQEMSKEKQL